MTLRLLAAVAAVMLISISPTPAQTSAPSDTPAVRTQETEAPARRPRTKKQEQTSPRQLTPKQLAFRERQKKCSVEWHSAKSAGTLERGLTWRKFLSQCNARLKGDSA